MFGSWSLVATPLLVLLGAVVFLGARSLEPAARSRAGPEEPGRGIAKGLLPAWGLALVALVASALGAWWLAATGGPPPGLGDTRWAYLDKRWLVFLYASGVLSTLVLPLLVTFLRSHRRDAHARGAPRSGESADRPTRRALRAGLGVLLATALFGPPWNTDGSVEPIDIHEQVHWSGLQAIDRGHVPYVGAASFNYGPGMQIAGYAYMKGTGQFTVPGFRETFAVALWIAVSLVFAALFALLDWTSAFVAAFLVLLMSPVALWTWLPSGVLSGFFGWGNALRGVASLLVALALYGLVRRPRPLAAIAWGGAAIGAAWGLLACYDQQNLGAGLAAIGLIGAALLGTRTLDERALLVLAGGLVLGFGVAWLPMLAYHAGTGTLDQLAHNYSLVPSRFMRGYANTAYLGPIDSDPYAVAYRVLPYLTVGVALLALYRPRPLSVSAPLDESRLLIFCSCAALLAAYPSSMLRADAWHLLGTLFALPLVISASLIHLPRVLSGSRVRRAIVRATVLLVAANVFGQVLLDAPERLREVFSGRMRSFSVAPATLSEAADEIERRYGPSLLPQARALGHVGLMRAVRSRAGDRPTLVHLDGYSHGIMYAGYVYFLADIAPAPIWLERTDLVADEAMVARFLEHLEAHIDGVDVIVSMSPDIPEVRILDAACQQMTATQVRSARQSFFVHACDRR